MLLLAARVWIYRVNLNLYWQSGRTRIARITWVNSETIGAIGMIRTITWKPGIQVFILISFLKSAVNTENKINKLSDSIQVIFVHNSCPWVQITFTELTIIDI